MKRAVFYLILMVCCINCYSQAKSFTCDVINHENNTVLRNLNGKFELTQDDAGIPCICVKVKDSTRKGKIPFMFWTDIDATPTLRYKAKSPGNDSTNEKRDIYWFINSDDEIMILYTEYSNGVAGSIVMTQIYNGVAMTTCKIHSSDYIRSIIYKIIDKAKDTINFNFE